MNIGKTTASLLELSDMAHQCMQTSDNVLLKINLVDLNQSVGDFFRVCADQISKYSPPEQNEECEEISTQEEQTIDEYLTVENRNNCDVISLEIVDKTSDIVSTDISGNTELEKRDILS